MVNSPASLLADLFDARVDNWFQERKQSSANNDKDSDTPAH